MLVAALSDPNQDVCDCAAWALDQFGSTSPALVKALVKQAEVETFLEATALGRSGGGTTKMPIGTLGLAARIGTLLTGQIGPRRSRRPGDPGMDDSERRWKQARFLNQFFGRTVMGRSGFTSSWRSGGLSRRMCRSRRS